MPETEGSKHQVITLEVYGQPELNVHQFIVWGLFHHRTFRIASQVLQEKLKLPDRSNIKSVRESPFIIINDNPREDEIRTIENRRRDVPDKFDDDYWADETYIYDYKELTNEERDTLLGHVAAANALEQIID